MKPNERIKARRGELKLTDTDVANRIGLSIPQYFAIELHDYEIFELVDIKYIKRICEVLNMDFLELLDIPCDFCEQNKSFLKDYSLPRNELIKKRRESLGLSPEQLGDEIGFYENAVHKMEREPDFLESWRIVDIKNLALALNIPFQILLEVKCKKCGN